MTLAVPLEPAKGGGDQAANRKRRPEKAARQREAKKIRILLVDDHTMVRQGLSQLLAAEPDFEVVGEASEGSAAIRVTEER